MEKCLFRLSWMFASFLCFGTSLFAKDELTNRWTIGSDLMQPLLFGGWNINGYYYLENGMTLGWSHGENLQFDADAEWANAAQKEENASNFIDWSTGPEIGYRISKHGDLRFDFKLHKFDIHWLDSGERLSYKTRTVGPTYYYHLYPFDDHFVVELSARYWFYAGDSAPDSVTYRTANGESKLHDPEKFTEGTSGPGLNVSFGWTL